MKTIKLLRNSIVWLLALLAIANPVQAALIDLGNTPLATSSTTSVLPNMLLVLDDSGSMAWSHMPDVSSDAGSSVVWGLGYYGARSSQCNGVYYNPTIHYTPPVYADGTSYPNASFTAALPNGFAAAGTSNTAVDLSTAYKYTDSSGPTSDSTGQAAYYYVYTGSQTTPAQQDYNSTTNTFYQECNSASGATPGSNVFTKVTVSSTSGPGGTDERTNFANWYSYYRTRMLMMKTAAGQAFKNLDTHYRVGFMAINSNSSFLNLATFDSSQKSSWYTKLYGISPSGSTPLRTALSNAGKLYANKLSFSGVTINDPVQYSCQQNFALLSTDGFWNTGAGSDLNGNAVGNQDGASPRPYYDGATVTITQSTSQVTQTQTQINKSTSQIQSDTTQIQSSTSRLQQQTSQLQRQISQLQQQTSQLQQQTSQLQRQTSQLQRRTSSNSGVSWSSWQGVSSCTVDLSGRNQTDCRTVVTAAFANASSCTTDSSPDSNGFTTQCQTVVSSPYANASSCTATSTPNGSGQTTQCRYTAWSAGTNVSLCTPVPQSLAPNYTVGTAVNCPTVVSSPYANVSSCTASGTPDANGQTTQCQTVVSSPYANVGSCTQTTTPNGSGQTTQCQYTTWTTWANASTCTAVNQSSAPNYTVGTATQCQTTDTGWVPASSCSPSSSGGRTVTCQTVTTGPTPIASCSNALPTSPNYITTTCNTLTLMSATPVASCTASSASSSNNYTTTTCNTVTTGPTTVASCTASPASSSNNYTATTCGVTTTGGSSDSLSDVAMYYYMTDLRDSGLSNCTGALGADVCTDNVPTSGQDGASWQHMTLFTMSLGVHGRMLYSPTYQSDSTGDYPAVSDGLAANPPSVCSWQASGSGACNWPVPGMANSSDGKIENIDDLWHAAVDGRGTFYSATDPTSLSTSLNNALSALSTRKGAAAAATTSTPNVTATNNYVFSTTYTTHEWSGEVIRQRIDTITGTIPVYNPNDTSTFDWTAQGQLDDNASRTLYYSQSGALTRFLWSNMNSTVQAYFNTPNISGLSQFCSVGAECLSASAKTSAAGANLVAYLAGTRTYEGAVSSGKYYRQRLHLLGDTVNAEPIYVQASTFSYADPGYGTFGAGNASRQGMVYVGANDGMLHAFNADTGAEAWAFIPSHVLPNLYKLADENYSSQHQYFVDGTPVVGDICTSHCTDAATAVWKTILVGGLNGGGRGYYALDITNPASPSLLWEYTNTNMGYTYGNPIITKQPDGTWVVMVTSGYNNVSSGDGVGRLYLLNAATGVLSSTISTGVGDTTTPSGLARISAWADSANTNNTTVRVYGGDMFGNVWRFDLANAAASPPVTAGVQLLATLQDSGNNAQPITVKPELSLVNTYPVVYVGTGRYLGTTDEADTSQQSFYAIKDNLVTTGTPGTAIYGSPRAHTCTTGATTNCFVTQTVTSATCPTGVSSSICTTGQAIRSSTNNSVDFGSQYGWYIDLPGTGERDNTDPKLVLGTLLFDSNIPSGDSCSIGGSSFRYFLDYRTGGPILSATATGFTSSSSSSSSSGGSTSSSSSGSSTSSSSSGSSSGGSTSSSGSSSGTGTTTTTGVVGQNLGNALASAPVVVQLPNGTVVECIRMSDGTTQCPSVPINPSTSLSARRVSWRELINDQ